MADPIPYRLALDALPQIIWTADALPQIIWTADPDGRVEYMNRRAAEFFGLPIDDLLGGDWSWLVHPADLPATLAAWDAAVRAGREYEAEFRLRRHDGEYRWFLSRAEPYRGAEGHVVRWFGTCTDVDESRRAADQFRGVRPLFRGLVERSADGLALVGSDGTVRYANHVAAELLGFRPDDLAGTDLWGSVAPEDRQSVVRWWQGVLSSPGERSAMTARFMSWVQTPRPLRVMATNLLPDPDVRGVAVQLRAVEVD